jgi:hypothetical protein
VFRKPVERDEMPRVLEKLERRRSRYQKYVSRPVSVCTV